MPHPGTCSQKATTTEQNQELGPLEPQLLAVTFHSRPGKGKENWGELPHVQ